MLQNVDTGRRSIHAYRGIVPDEILDSLLKAADALRGARVAHINATAYGGGVSELLRSVVPLYNDLGITTDWKVIRGDDAFFKVTKKMHNALQGARTELSHTEKGVYLDSAEMNAKAFEEHYDFVVIHDPQPAAMLSFRGKVASRWVWRCHIDTRDPDPGVWGFLRGFLEGYDAAVFTMREFVPADMPIADVEIIPPAIDPLSPKNLPLPEHLARQILAWVGMDFDRPIVTQVSRFDPWKDPLGVIDAYRLARERVPSLELVLAGSMALDDPEGWSIYERVRAESAKDPLIHIFSNLSGVSNVEINAFQQISDVIVQKSTREGFGLVVSEAMWKGTPVVAGRAGGIPLQMADGAGGILVDDVASCADAIVRLMQNAEEARALGEAGRERVRRRFLLPRLILDFMHLLEQVELGQEAHKVPAGGPVRAGADRGDARRGVRHDSRQAGRDRALRGAHLPLLLGGMPRELPARPAALHRERRGRGAGAALAVTRSAAAQWPLSGQIMSRVPSRARRRGAAAELGRDRQLDRLVRGLREVVARDLAHGVGQRLLVHVAEGELELADAGLLEDLALRRGELVLAGLDQPFGKVPVGVGAQHQQARAARAAAEDHRAGGTEFRGGHGPIVAKAPPRRTQAPDTTGIRARP